MVRSLNLGRCSSEELGYSGLTVGLVGFDGVPAQTDRKAGIGRAPIDRKMETCPSDDVYSQDGGDGNDKNEEGDE